MANTELKPCPFCGGTEVYAEISFLTKEFRIYCADPESSCPVAMRLSFSDAGLGDGSIVSFYEMETIMEQLIEAWNRRADNEQREAD
jgi:hypothetical protein